MDNLSIGVTIGAAIGSAFHNSVATAEKKLHKIGDTVKKISQERAQFKPFERAEANLEQARQKLQAANQAVMRLKSDMAKSPSPALAKALAKAETAAQQASQAFDKQHIKVQQIKTDLRANGIEVGNYRKEVERLGSALEKAQAEQTALAKRVQMKSSITEERANYRSQALDAIALGMTVSAPIKVAMEFEASIDRLGGITSATQEEMAKLSDTAKKLGSSTTFSASQSAQAMSYLGMAGFNTNQILDATPGLLDLAAAAGSDLGQTADIASNILSGMGLKADQMGRVGDVLASTFTSSNTTLEMLGETMKYVAPNAAGLGISLEEVAALSGKLGDVGIQGSMAGTALRAAMIRLASPPKMAADALKELGVSVKDENGNFIGMTATLKKLDASMQGLSDTDKLAAITKIFGTEAASAMSELTKQAGSGALDEYIAKLENANGRSADLAKKMNDNASGAFKAFGSAMEGLSITLGETLLPVLTSLTLGITSVVSSVSAFAAENPTLTTTIVGLGAGLIGLKIATIGLGYAFTFIKGGILGATGLFSALRTGAMALAPVLPVVATGIKAIGVAIAANPIGLLVTGLAAGAVAIYTYWEPISDFFRGIFDNIKATLAPVIDVFKTAFSFSPLGLIVTNFEGVKTFLSILPEQFMSLGGDIIDGLMNGLKSKFTAVTEFASNLGSSISSGFKSVLGIQSPSKVMIQAGLDTASGIEVGLTKGEQGVQTQMGAIAKTLATTTLVAGTLAPPAFAGVEPGKLPDSQAKAAYQTVLPAQAGIGDLTATAGYQTLNPQFGTLPNLKANAAYQADGFNLPKIQRMELAQAIASKEGQKEGQAKTEQTDLSGVNLFNASAKNVPSAQAASPVFNQTFNININAQAGQDANAIAQQVIEQIKQQSDIARRTAMGDWA